MRPSPTVSVKLSLGSFVKLSVIAAIGTLPVVGVLFVIAFLIRLTKSPGFSLPETGIAWLPLMLRIIIAIVSAVLSGLFTGLCGYPFYSWLCRRRGGGIELKGSFDERTANPENLIQPWRGRRI